MTRVYKRFKTEISHTEGRYVDSITKIGCDENAQNIIINSFLQCGDFRLHNNPRLSEEKVLDNGYYEYL